MNANLLLTHFDRIADVPDAVSRLRRFVLDLAVRGKLVPQDANDGPAAIPVSARKQHNLGKVCPADIPGWLVAPVGLLLEFRYGKGMKASDRLDAGPVPVFGSNGVVGYSETPLTDAPCIIIGRKGSAGSLNLCNGPSWTTDVAYFVKAPDYFDLRYLLIGLETLDLGSLGKGVKPGLSRSDAYELPLAVPPLAEQHRIVAKVDELMALCDRLEAARTARETTRNRLTATSLARLNAPNPDPPAFRKDAALALDNLTPLTTRPDQVKTLRQTILNLAVRGKLVPQDPNDEPASELLKKIAQGQRGPIRKSKLLPPINNAEAPFDLLPGWAWARFPEVGLFGRGKSKHRPRNDPALYEDGTYPFIQTGDVARSGGSIESYSNLYNDVGLAQSAMWPAGTLCITIAANIADSGILKFDACFPDSIVGLIVHDSLEDARFFEYFLRTAKADLHEFAPSTAQKNINLGILQEVLIPLPPLAEQRRIVAKVDALMALCDRLEANLNEVDRTSRYSLDALLRWLVMTPCCVGWLLRTPNWVKIAPETVSEQIDWRKHETYQGTYHGIPEYSGLNRVQDWRCHLLGW